MKNLRFFCEAKNGFGAIYNAIYFRFDLEDNIDRCAFFYELNIGWYDMYHPENGMRETLGTIWVEKSLTTSPTP